MKMRMDTVKIVSHLVELMKKYLNYSIIMLSALIALGAQLLWPAALVKQIIILDMIQKGA